jgi:hypothetical protein
MTIPPHLRSGRVLSRSAALYQEPSTSSSPLGRVQRDEDIIILEGDENSSWLKIEDERGQIGYVERATPVSVISVCRSANEGAAWMQEMLASMPSEKQGGTKEMVGGGLLCAAGILLTALNYNLHPGGWYIVFTGAIFGGGAAFIRGLFRRFRA